MSNNTTNHVGKRVVSGQVGIGTNAATAYTLENECYYEFTSVSSSTGAVLPAAKLPSSISIFNASTNTLSVYPPVGGISGNGATATGELNGGSSAYSLAAGSGVTFFATDIYTWYAIGGSGGGGLSAIAADSLLANSTGSSAVPEAVTLGTGLSFSGTTLVATGGLNAIAADSILANPTGSSAVPEAVSLGANLSFSGTTLVGNSGIVGLTGDVNTAQSTSGNVAALFAGQSTAITPSISTSQNNWAPTGLLTAGALVANVIQVSVTASGVNLTGLVPPSAGTIGGATVTVQNAYASIYPLRFSNNSSSSTAANRFGFLSDVFIDPGESVVLQYDATGSLWREFSPHKEYRADLWGSAKDGTVTASTGSLTRNMYYDNLTIGASTVLTCEGFDIFVNGILDLSAASAGSIVFNGGAGGNGAASITGGTAGASGLAQYCSGYIQDGGKTGSLGATGNGVAGVQSTPRTIYNAITQSSSAGGGAGGTGTAGAASGPSAATQATLQYQAFPTLTYIFGSSIYQLAAGQQGCSGGGGGGDGTNAGGGGGGGGAPGGGIRLFARKINMGSNTTAGIIQAKGGAGGNGGTPTAGNAGGGGGGGGGSGGTVIVQHAGVFGTGGANAIDISGGSGGNSGAGVGSGTAGGAATSGPGGYCQVMDMRTGTATVTLGSARVTGSGSTGGVAATSQVNL